MSEDRVTGRCPLSILGQTKDDTDLKLYVSLSGVQWGYVTYSDHAQGEIDRVEQPSPGESSGLKFLHANLPAGLHLNHFPVKIDCEAQKPEDKKFLHSNAAHVDVQAQHDCLGFRVRVGCQRGAPELNQEGDDVQHNEHHTVVTRRDAGQFTFRDKEIYHPP